ncbi:MAG: TolC family protein [Bacteroidetes bacterium]|nr:TolC family protein [Bacteroidota bacterium]
MKKYALTFFIALLFPGAFVSMGRAQSSSSFDMFKDDISEKLPGLSKLIDSAVANSPEMQFGNLQVSIDKRNLHTIKSQWTNNFGVQANYGYGTFDYLYNSTAGGNTPPTYTLNSSLSQYGVGAYLRIPFDQIFNRSNQVKMGHEVIEQAKTLVETENRKIRDQVIHLYNDLILKQRLLQIKSRYLETSRINMQMAEKGFLNGTVSIDNYSQVTEIATRTESDFEMAKTEFLTSYMMLEELTGMKFNIYNEIHKQ